jgi:hypothetical protein
MKKLLKKKMTKKEFLGLFKKYVKAVDKCGAIPLLRVRQNLTCGECSFRSDLGFYWEVMKSGKAKIMSARGSKEFQDACDYFKRRTLFTPHGTDLKFDMLHIIDSLIWKKME